jgi:hypothetical protein
MGKSRMRDIVRDTRFTRLEGHSDGATGRGALAQQATAVGGHGSHKGSAKRHERGPSVLERRRAEEAAVEAAEEAAAAPR